MIFGESPTMLRFRLSSPTIAVRRTRDGSHLSFLIPAGGEVSTDEDLLVLTRPTLEWSKMISITWNGQEASIFLIDLQLRGEQLP